MPALERSLRSSPSSTRPPLAGQETRRSVIEDVRRTPIGMLGRSAARTPPELFAGWFAPVAWTGPYGIRPRSQTRLRARHPGLAGSGVVGLGDVPRVGWCCWVHHGGLWRRLPVSPGPERRTDNRKSGISALGFHRTAPYSAACKYASLTGHRVPRRRSYSFSPSMEGVPLRRPAITPGVIEVPSFRLSAVVDLASEAAAHA